MDVDVCVSVSRTDFVVIDFGKPVVSCDSTGVRKDKTAYRVCYCGVFLNSPVVDLDIVV